MATKHQCDCLKNVTQDKNNLIFLYFKYTLDLSRLPMHTLLAHTFIFNTLTCSRRSNICVGFFINHPIHAQNLSLNHYKRSDNMTFIQVGY